MDSTAGLTVATVGADRLQTDSLPEILGRHGVQPGRLLAFAGSPSAIKLAVDDAGALVCLPLEREMVGQADAVFLFSGDAGVLDTLTGWARSENFWLVDLRDDTAGPWRLPAEGADSLRKGGPLLAVPDVDAWCCAALLGALGTSVRGPLTCHSLRPASAKGAEGVQELFHQSVAALNFRQGPVEVFGKTLAFNLLPATPSAKEVAAFLACLRALAGPAARASRVVIRVSVFHATALSVLVPVGDVAAAVKSATAGLKKRGFSAARGDTWPMPLDEKGLHAIRFRLAPADAEHLWAYFLYDDLKAGKMAMGAALLAALSGGG